MDHLEIQITPKLICLDYMVKIQSDPYVGENHPAKFLLSLIKKQRMNFQSLMIQDKIVLTDHTHFIDASQFSKIEIYKQDEYFKSNYRTYGIQCLESTIIFYVNQVTIKENKKYQKTLYKNILLQSYNKN